MTGCSPRRSLPRGVTHVHVARLFLRGLSIDWVALKFNCGSSVIEHAIRSVLRRQVTR